MACLWRTTPKWTMSCGLNACSWCPTQNGRMSCDLFMAPNLKMDSVTELIHDSHIGDRPLPNLRGLGPDSGPDLEAQGPNQLSGPHLGKAGPDPQFDAGICCFTVKVRVLPQKSCQNHFQFQVFSLRGLSPMRERSKLLHPNGESLFKLTLPF